MPPPPKKWCLRLQKNKLISGFDTPPPTFFDGGGVKKKLKVGRIQKSFQTECATSKFFLEAVSKKVQIKKPEQPCKCTSALAWSNSKIPPCGNFSDTSNFFSMEVVSKIFSTTSMFFRHHLQVFFNGGGVKKVQIKKSQSARAKCTSALAWSVKFKFFSNPNVWNGTSWSLTTLSKKFNLVKFKKFFYPNVGNGTSWSLTTLDFFRAPSSKRD